MPLVWLLLGAALMLRVLVPAGWMPQLGEQGFRIAVCSGNASGFITLGRDGKLHKEAPKPAAPGDTCPYALASSMAANATPKVLQLAQRIATPAIIAPARARFSLAPQPDQRPPATGPPPLA